MAIDTLQPFEQAFMISPHLEQEEDASKLMYMPRETENYLMETFHQYPHGDFRPTFYNPFEIKHRRRTSRAQQQVLEDAFSNNPKPNSTIRRVLAQKLEMTPRGVQIWFQNRRAKEKSSRRKPTILNENFKQESYTESEEKISSIDVAQPSISLPQSSKSTYDSTYEPLVNVEWPNYGYQQNAEKVQFVHGNARTLATAAAAIAVASSNRYEFTNPIESFRIMQQTKAENRPSEKSRATIDNQNEDQASYMSPSTTLKDNYFNTNSTLLSQIDLTANLYAYTFNVMDTTYNYPQLPTPPLTATCSNAGSPILCDGLYNDSLVLPNNNAFHLNEPNSSIPGIMTEFC